MTAENIIYQILNEIEGIAGEIKIIAIDGRCGAGKSTLAEMLSEETGAGVIHMDDFFLPTELRTRERLAQPGGNVHYERFREEVLSELSEYKKEQGTERQSDDIVQAVSDAAVQPGDFTYRRFDCHTMDYGDLRTVKGSGIYIVEGAYSCAPMLGNYMDLKIFADVGKELQLQRILKRGGEAALQSFKERWIPLEEAYFKAYHIMEQSDLVIDMSILDCYDE